MAKMSSTLKFLESVPLFRSLNPEDLKVVGENMRRENFNAGETVFRQGDPGDCFYIVADGQADVLVSKTQDNFTVGETIKLAMELTIGGIVCEAKSLAVVDKYDNSREYPYTIRMKHNGKRGRVLAEEIIGENEERGPEQKIASLKAGDYFGEQSLLKKVPRNATIKAGTNLVLAALDGKKFFDDLQFGDKLTFAKRKAIQTVDKEPAPGGDTSKTEEEKELIETALMNNKRLRQIVNLDKGSPLMEKMVERAYRRVVTNGEKVIVQGDMENVDEFYCVTDGEFEISVNQDGMSDNVVGRCGPSSSFGELALLYKAPRAATVTCRTANGGVVYVIDRWTFKDVLKQASKDKTDAFLKILTGIDLFACLLSEEKEALANSVIETHYVQGDKIITEGEPGSVFYILVQGKVTFSKDGKELMSKDTKAKCADPYFGERALLTSEPRAATATVTSEEAILLALSKSRFEDLLGPLQALLDAHNKGGRKKQEGKGGTARKMDTIKKEDLKCLGLLGCGGFGAVTLEQHKTTQQVYALKKLSKGYIVKTKMKASVMNEKNILALCDSDFIIKLWATFKDDQNLYFLLEPAMGGELYATYHKRRFHGDVAKCKYYTGSVVFCFEYMHGKNIIYRDLKPENLLLTDVGACKITDMGLAKVVIGKTYTTCGTPDYFAPEVIQQSGIARGVDWWTLGVLTHELLCGHAPFEANDPMETYQKIVRGVNHIKFPYKDSDAQDYVKNMLKHQPAERLPMRVGGTKNIKDHKFYKGFDWNALFDRSMPVPYKPSCKGPTDKSNFKASEADLPPSIQYKDDGTGWDKDF